MQRFLRFAGFILSSTTLLHVTHAGEAKGVTTTITSHKLDDVQKDTPSMNQCNCSDYNSKTCIGDNIDGTKNISKNDATCARVCCPDVSIIISHTYPLHYTSGENPSNKHPDFRNVNSVGETASKPASITKPKAKSQKRRQKVKKENKATSIQRSEGSNIRGHHLHYKCKDGDKNCDENFDVERNPYPLISDKSADGTTFDDRHDVNTAERLPIFSRSFRNLATSKDSEIELEGTVSEIHAWPSGRKEHHYDTSHLKVSYAWVGSSAMPSSSGSIIFWFALGVVGVSISAFMALILGRRPILSSHNVDDDRQEQLSRIRRKGLDLLVSI